MIFDSRSWYLHISHSFETLYINLNFHPEVGVQCTWKYNKKRATAFFVVIDNNTNLNLSEDGFHSVMLYNITKLLQIYNPDLTVYRLYECEKNKLTNCCFNLKLRHIIRIYLYGYNSVVYVFTVLHNRYYYVQFRRTNIKMIV